MDKKAKIIVAALGTGIAAGIATIWEFIKKLPR